jgi:hypothetical protein
VSEFTEPVVGWRRWRVEVADGLLHSHWKSIMWPPGEAMIARCVKSSSFQLAGRECREAPRKACSCGIYALTSLDIIGDVNVNYPYISDGILPRSLDVYGRVSLWGRVIVASRGYRGQYAYPYELIVQAPRADSADWYEKGVEHAKFAAQKLRALYMVDVEVES